ncbi:hypothetical protein GCM10009676_40600 [Prauserella halophila]|uniref:Uncharacterized protein n=1 Tax=Prauserella halophila TaxID=185641 RepID=A0ABP4H4I0_9PSEU
MAVDDDGLVAAGAVRGGDVEQQHRGAAGQFDDLGTRTGEAAGVEVGAHVVHGRVQLPRRRPLGVERRGQGRYLDQTGQAAGRRTGVRRPSDANRFPNHRRIHALIQTRTKV